MRDRKTKIVTVVGARPQFIKAAVVSPLLREYGLNELIVHTGQHYDFEMSDIFFKGLNLPKPAYNLGIGSHSHGKQTGMMIEALEKVLLKESPFLVIVYGDTNSTLAGAIASSKLHIPIAHIEAGLRSFDKFMPEEINRVLTDHISDLLFAPTLTGIENLKREGISKGVYLCGDVMFDLFKKTRKLFEKEETKILNKYKLDKNGFAFVTVHRAENTDNKDRWTNILSAFKDLSHNGIKIVWPVHPRTKKLIKDLPKKNFKIVSPLSYLETQVLVSASKVVITDSGGLQKEAAFHAKQCLILRDRTEWVELEKAGMAITVNDDRKKIVEAALKSGFNEIKKVDKIFGNGKSGVKIVNEISKYISLKS
jgi:UDP-N-acetylglucosamine 2-epimerase